MNWRRAITGGPPHKNWWGWPSRRSAVGWPSLLDRAACAFSAISWTIPRRTWSNCNARSTSCWTRIPRPQACWASRNLARRRWRCCGQNWGISRASRASTRWSPTLGWIGPSQAERQMERADQAVQTRQRPSAPYPLPGRVAEHSPGNISLWGFLPAPGGAFHEKGHGGGGSHAQHVDCRRPSDPDGGELRCGESGQAGRELAAQLAPCLPGAPPTVERQSLWTSSRGQGKCCARGRHHRLFTVRVFGIAWTKGLTNSMASTQVS